MKEYMLLDSSPITDAEIQKALHRARELRSEAAWTLTLAVLNAPVKFVRSLRKSKALDDTGLVHS